MSLHEITKAYVSMVEATNTIEVSIKDTPKTNSDKSYEGSWKAGVGITNDALILAIKAKIGAKVKYVGIFDAMGYERSKPTPFSGSGSFIAK